MDMVGHGIDREEITTATPDDAADVSVHIITPSIFEAGLASFGAEHKMHKNVRKGLRHRCYY